jgi:hypothetical protein
MSRAGPIPGYAESLINFTNSLNSNEPIITYNWHVKDGQSKEQSFELLSLVIVQALKSLSVFYIIYHMTPPGVYTLAANLIVY